MFLEEVAMFNHVMVGANDIDESKYFYDAVLGALGIPPGVKDSEVRCNFCRLRCLESSKTIFTIILASHAGNRDYTSLGVQIHGDTASKCGGLIVGFSS